MEIRVVGGVREIDKADEETRMSEIHSRLHQGAKANVDKFKTLSKGTSMHGTKQDRGGDVTSHSAPVFLSSRVQNPNVNKNNNAGSGSDDGNKVNKIGAGDAVNLMHLLSSYDDEYDGNGDVRSNYNSSSNNNNNDDDDHRNSFSGKDHEHFGDGGKSNLENGLEASSEEMQQYIHQIHEKNVKINAVSMQLDHALLHIEAIKNNEAKLLMSNEKLLQSLALAEEHKLLTDAHLKDIANFEKSGSKENHYFNQIRQQLLKLHDETCSELMTENSKLQQSRGKESFHLTQERDQYKSEVASLRLELNNLSTQLAQKIVICSAQERRYNQTYYRLESLHIDKDKQIASLQSQLAQYKDMFDKSQEDRTKYILKSKQLEESNSVMEDKFANAQNSIIALDNNCTTFQAENVRLQAILDRMRGGMGDTSDLAMSGISSDMGIESFANQNTAIDRLSESKVRENILKKQVFDLQDQLHNESSAKVKLKDKINNLRSELSTYQSINKTNNDLGISRDSIDASSARDEVNNAQRSDLQSDFTVLFDSDLSDVEDSCIDLVPAMSSSAGRELTNSKKTHPSGIQNNVNNIISTVATLFEGHFRQYHEQGTIPAFSFTNWQDTIKSIFESLDKSENASFLYSLFMDKCVFLFLLVAFEKVAHKYNSSNNSRNSNNSNNSNNTDANSNNAPENVIDTSYLLGEEDNDDGNDNDLNTQFVSKKVSIHDDLQLKYDDLSSKYDKQATLLRTILERAANMKSVKVDSSADSSNKDRDKDTKISELQQYNLSVTEQLQYLREELEISQKRLGEAREIGRSEVFTEYHEKLAIVKDQAARDIKAAVEKEQFCFDTERKFLMEQHNDNVEKMQSSLSESHQATILILDSKLMELQLKLSTSQQIEKQNSILNGELSKLKEDSGVSMGSLRDELEICRGRMNAYKADIDLLKVEIGEYYEKEKRYDVIISNIEQLEQNLTFLSASKEDAIRLRDKKYQDLLSEYNLLQNLHDLTTADYKKKILQLEEDVSQVNKMEVGRVATNNSNSNSNSETSEVAISPSPDISAALLSENAALKLESDSLKRQLSHLNDMKSADVSLDSYLVDIRNKLSGISSASSGESSKSVVGEKLDEIESKINIFLQNSLQTKDLENRLRFEYEQKTRLESSELKAQYDSQVIQMVEEVRLSLTSKYKEKIHLLKARHKSDNFSLMEYVRKECQDILNETVRVTQKQRDHIRKYKKIIKELQQANNSSNNSSNKEGSNENLDDTEIGRSSKDSSSNRNNNRNSNRNSSHVDNDTGGKENENSKPVENITIYPEMLSPEFTVDLLKCFLKRSMDDDPGNREVFSKALSVLSRKSDYQSFGNNNDQQDESQLHYKDNNTGTSSNRNSIRYSNSFRYDAEDEVNVQESTFSSAEFNRSSTSSLKLPIKSSHSPDRASSGQGISPSSSSSSSSSSVGGGGSSKGGNREQTLSSLSPSSKNAPRPFPSVRLSLKDSDLDS